MFSLLAANLNSIVLYGTEPPTFSNGSNRGSSSSSSGLLPTSTSDLILCAGLVLAFVVFVVVVFVIVRLLRRKGTPPNAGYRLTPAGETPTRPSLTRAVKDFPWPNGIFPLVL